MQVTKVDCLIDVQLSPEECKLLADAASSHHENIGCDQSGADALCSMESLLRLAGQLARARWTSKPETTEVLDAAMKYMEGPNAEQATDAA